MNIVDRFRLLALKIKRQAYEEARQAFQHDARLRDRQGECQTLEVIQAVNRRIREIETRNKKKPTYTFKA